ncbi:chromosomal replication initiator protein DnaA [Dermabacter sp.]|uniref:chromosomal replication initiator protein DnaA n=1 Tax=Dermabacter sp. TaxID=37640 RepID=UPI0028FE022F|nr:chromosomal replication initiator protein DnaA [Dermabacter sp.]MDU1463378.1 chromosomal replication initiator protein DnaA [Dermabacter sp.]
MDETALDRDALWAECQQILRADDSVSNRHLAYVTLSSLRGFLEDTALIAVPNATVKDLFEMRIPDQLRSSLSQAMGKPVTFAVTIDPTLGLDDEPEPSAPSSTAPVDNVVDNSVNSSGSIPVTPRHDGDNSVNVASPWSQQPSDLTPYSPYTPAEGTDRAEAPASSSDLPTSSSLGNDSRLNPKYTFATFVVGASNRFAQAAAYAVAEQPALAYNPLFIYGGSGLGKTHLLHATGHYAKQLHPNIQVRYVNSEEFTNDFINSVQSGQFGKAQEFQRRYRDIDILLIDDIQFLQRAPETLEAFFHTFNTLHNANKQIVITSDLPPKLLGGLEDRMRSRFEMGLMTDVQPPDLETRIAILRKKVAAENTEEVPREVLEYIAENISTNIRELEGALIRVQALHSLSKQPMDVELAQNVLKDLLTHDGSAEITPNLIIAETAAYFGFGVDEIKGTARTRALVTARQCAMYLCRELTEMPLMAIGDAFGGRDHTTVIHAYKKVSTLMKERRALFNQVTELTARVKANAQEQGRH